MPEAVPRFAEAGRRTRGERRDALIDAAAQLIAEEGLRGVSHRAVAERAGVAHGLVRHHFTTLDSLVLEAVRRAGEESITLSLLEPGSGDLGELAAGLPDHVRAEPFKHAMSYELAREGLRRDDLGMVMRGIYDDYVAAVRRELERAGIHEDTDALARVVFAALDGLVLQQLIRGKPGELESGIVRLRELLALLPSAKGSTKPPVTRDRGRMSF